jgi:hypothetical protein
MHLEICMLLDAEQLGVELAWGDGVDPGYNSSKDCVVIFIQVGEQVGDEFIVK